MPAHTGAAALLPQSPATCVYMVNLPVLCPESSQIPRITCEDIETWHLFKCHVWHGRTASLMYIQTKPWTLPTASAAHKGPRVLQEQLPFAPPLQALCASISMSIRHLVPSTGASLFSTLICDRSLPSCVYLPCRRSLICTMSAQCHLPDGQPCSDSIVRTLLSHTSRLAAFRLAIAWCYQRPCCLCASCFVFGATQSMH